MPVVGLHTPVHNGTRSQIAQHLVEPMGVDGNGQLTERMWLGEQEVIIHRGDVPETDITTVDGIRCTTALRTVIDVAPSVA
jgi:hypothetical protein